MHRGKGHGSMKHQDEIRLSELAEKKFNGTITQEEAKVLESMLMKDRDARHLFLCLSSQHAELSALGETLAISEILAANRPEKKVVPWPTFAAAAAVLFAAILAFKWPGSQREETLVDKGEPAGVRDLPETVGPERPDGAMALTQEEASLHSLPDTEEVFGAPAQFEILNGMRTMLLEGGVMVRLTRSASAHPTDHSSEVVPHDDKGKIIKQDILNTVQFTMEFDAQALIDEGIEPEELQISFFNPAKKAWENTDTLEFDFASGTVKATASPFPILAAATAANELASAGQEPDPTSAGNEGQDPTTEPTDAVEETTDPDPAESTDPLEEEELDKPLLEGPLAGSKDLGGGWYSSPWMGLFYYDSTNPENDWIYQSQLGWLRLNGTDSTNVWIYSENPQLGWTWTNSNQFSATDTGTTDYFFRYSDSRWVYLENADGINRYYEFKTGLESEDPGWTSDP